MTWAQHGGSGAPEPAGSETKGGAEEGPRDPEPSRLGCRPGCGDPGRGKQSQDTDQGGQEGQGRARAPAGEDGWVLGPWRQGARPPGGHRRSAGLLGHLAAAAWLTTAEVGLSHPGVGAAEGEMSFWGP